MARPIDIEKKIKELRGYLIKYNGIPTQKENHAVHANLKYYINNHCNKPEIKALIDEFHLNEEKEKRNEDRFESRFEEIHNLLEKYQRIPKDSKDYQKVFYFFNHHKNNPEVKKLMYIYAHPDSYLEVIGKPITFRSYGGSYKYLCDDSDAYKYVKYIFEEYKELPARNTAPMKKVFMEIRRYKIAMNKTKYPIEYKFKKLFNFLQEMQELGCKDEYLLEIINE